MRQRRCTSFHTFGVIRKTLEALINALRHHEQSILRSFNVNDVRLALILPRFISKLLGGLRPRFRMNLYLSRHQVENIIYLIEYFATSSFQWQLVLVVISLNFIQTSLNVILSDLKRHLLRLMKANIELAQSHPTFG